jgi:hypothetical protein
MMESLREKCIYEMTRQTDKPNYNKWFKYMQEFISSCAMDVSQKCSEKVMEAVGIKKKMVNVCVDHVLKNKGQKNADILIKDRNTMLELGVVTQPAITINNQTYRGEMNGFDIFKGICHGFSTQPKYCQGDRVWELLMYDDDEVAEMENRVAPRYKVFIAIFIAVLINLGLLLLYRRHQRKKMNEEL